MAVFTPDSAGNLDKLTDLKKVQEYLYRMNEQLQYMFNNLTPEDNNAAGTPSLSYATGQSVRVVVDGAEMDVVLSDEIIREINRSIENAKINPDKVNINGIASANDGLSVASDGTPSLNNAALTGGTISDAAVTGGTITGSDISNASAANVAHQTGSVGPFDIDATGMSNVNMTLPATGEAELAELKLADSFWNGHSVTEVVKTIWDAVFPSP